LSYTSDLQSNNVDLQTILDKVNALPNSKLPELSNPASADNIDSGFEAVDSKGNTIVGTSTKIQLPELSNPATYDQILAGSEAVDDKGNLLVGTMPNQGSKSASLSFGEEFNIEEGYHDGTGKVTTTPLPALSNPAEAGDIPVGLEAVSSEGTLITGTGENLGDATAADVAAGKTFTSAAGLNVVGTNTAKPVKSVTYHTYYDTRDTPVNGISLGASGAQQKYSTVTVNPSTRVYIYTSATSGYMGLITTINY